MRVRGNEADFGGGILTYGEGTLTLGAGARVASNIAVDNGGGIYNGDTLTMLGDSQVVNSEAAAGGRISNVGTATLLPGAIVTDNIPDNCEPTIGTCS